ncbi:hypothetical protein ALC60_01503 [Trachymyrmex zeteki]|uniref:Uncharacterized protein n=1 Tax=Mycetomoellerius zeteki TaxID=64791 RepID=A0A151XGU2_9HYME|nr:hypothetical protein ALC60_01503 [Trachymyrmex zeteki]
MTTAWWESRSIATRGWDGSRSLEARKLSDHMCRHSCQPACLNEIISG